MALSISTHGSGPNQLAAALNEFQEGLTIDQKAQLTAVKSVPDPSAVIAFTAQVDRKNAERKSRCVASRVCGVLLSVQKYSTILDTYSQSHADIAALVWGSIKFTILIASNFTAFFDKLSEWLMRLGTCCPRYSEYQALYQQFPRLQDALDAFYATVVRFCAKAIQVVERTGIVQYAKSLWTTFETEFGDIERELKRRNENVTEETRLASEQAASQARHLQAIDQQAASEYRKDGRLFRKRVDQSRNETRAWRKQVDQRESSERYSRRASQNAAEYEVTGARKQRLLDQLSTYDHLAALKENHRKRHGTTSTWLSKRAEYLKWLESILSSVFWLSGILGSGKSVLTAAVIDDLYCRNTGDTFISFFFCKDNDAESQNARTILSSLIRQCLTVDGLRNDVEDQLAKLSMTSSSDTQELYPLFKLVSSLTGTHFIVIDGFDECPRADRDAVLAVLQQLMLSSQSSIKIFLASREDIGKEIPKVFRSCERQTMIRQEVDEDIATYVEGVLEMRMEQGDLTVGNPELVFEIRDALVQGACGMFLWAAFQIEEICEQTCDEDIRRVIRELPRDLTETYERALRRVSERGKAKIAEKVYRWVAAVRRPLCLEELREAISIEPCQDAFRPDRLVNNMEQMIPWCGNLVTLNEEDQLVQFAHYTVKQFLISECSSSTTERFHFQPLEADHQVGEVCVTYLNFNDFQRQLIRPSKLHGSIDPKALLTTSLSANQKSKAWTKIGRMWKTSKVADTDVLHQLSCVSGNNKVDTFQTMQKKYSFLTYAIKNWLFHTSSFRETARTWGLWRQLVHAEETFAAPPWSSDDWTNGDRKIAQYIIEHNHSALLLLARTEAEGEEVALLAKNSSMLLRSASERGQLQLVEMILNSEVCLKKDLDNSLQLAATGGHLQVARRLLAAGAEVNTQADLDRDCTALQAAAGAGHLDVVEWLLAAKANVNARSSTGRTALDAAAEGGHLGVIKRLLAAKAAVNTEVWYRDYTARKAAGRGAFLDDIERLLELAGEGRYSDDIERLLELAGEGEYVDDIERLLEAAAGGGHLEVVEQLLAANFKVSAAALQAAAGGGHLEVVERLLAAKADINPESYYCYTALHSAAEGGHLKVVERLLAAKADVNAISKNGRTVLEMAAANGHPEVVKRLLLAKADVNAESGDGRTALHSAAEGGHLKVIELLLAAKADINPESYSGYTALQSAAEGGHLAVVERLLAAKADVNAKSKNGYTALETAAGYGHPEVVGRLLAANTNLNAKRAASQAALQVAAEGGHLEVVERLLAAKADVNVKSKNGYTVLETAAGYGHLKVVERLLAAGADVNAKSVNGYTALHSAAKGGHLKVVEQLLAAKADVNAKTAAGQTALQAAADSGHLEVVERLLAAKADVNARTSAGGTALEAAAGGGYLDVVERLLAAKAQVNTGALPAAAKGGYLSMVERLLAAKANVNAKSSHGYTALGMAAEIGHLEIVELLLAAKADVNAKSVTGRTALGMAAECGHLDVVKQLLAANADVNAKSEYDGRTALHAAAEGGHLDVVDRLLAANADVDHKAIQAARGAGYAELAERLLLASMAANAPL